MIDDIPIFIEGVELVERPRFENEKEFAAYIAKIMEGRDAIIVLEHPHDEDCNVLGVYIACEAPSCPQGCDALITALAVDA